MPYKHKDFLLPKKHDRRIKLTDIEREQIKKDYGKISQRKLAKIYNVSRRLIQFIGDPYKHKRNLECRKLRGGTMIYYDKDKHREAMKEHRRYKQELYLKGELNKNG